MKLYTTAAKQHRQVKDFEEGDLALVHLRKERFPKSTCHKLESRKFSPCNMVRKISSNAYLIKLLSNLQISPFFNVSNLYCFKGFDGDVATTAVQVHQLPTMQPDVVEDMLDIKEVTSRRGNKYRQFLVKWLDKQPVKVPRLQKMS